MKTRVSGAEEGDKETKEKKKKGKGHRGNLCQRGDCRRLVAAERVSEHEREKALCVGVGVNMQNFSRNEGVL